MSKKEAKRIQDTIPMIDDLFTEITGDFDVSKRHGYILIGVAESEKGIQCAAIKADHDHMKDIVGFEEQFEYGGFITPLLTLLQNVLPEATSECINEVHRRDIISKIPDDLKKSFDKLVDTLQ